jgi:hypothetical protein
MKGSNLSVLDVDLFIKISGKTNWIRQMGSDNGNDHMAPRGGITINKDGNVLIFGDTNGAFFRELLIPDRKVNEVFLMEVDKNGRHKPYVRHQKALAAPAPALGPSVTVPGAEPLSTAPPFLVSSSDSPAKTKKGLSKAALTSLLVVGSLVLVVVVIFLVFCLRERLRSRAEQYGVPKSKDGVMKIDKGKTFAKAPPSSVFGGSDDHHNDYSENLKIEDKDII